MDLTYVQGQSVQAFFIDNTARFVELFEIEAAEVLTLLEDESIINKMYALDSAKNVVNLLVKEHEDELIQFAIEHGRNWGQKSGKPIEVKMIWFQKIRDLMWRFLLFYATEAGINSTQEIFQIERQINHALDTFIRHHIASFERTKNELLQAQRELIDELTVSIIPLSDSIAILPIVGVIETRRARRIQEKALEAVAKQQITKLVIDLSNVAFVDTAVVGHLFRIVDGIRILGCETIITGINAAIANTMIEQGINVAGRLTIKANLRQALQGMQL